MITKVYGPPGTGKTRYIRMKIEEMLKNSHYFMMDVCCCSLTRTAASEMLNRVTGDMFCKDSDIEYFGTIHSICFNLLKLRPEQVAEGSKVMNDFKEYASDIKFDDETWKEMDLNRLRLLPLEEWSDQSQNLWDKWLDFMVVENDLYDYIRMLEECLENKLKLPQSLLLFVDEAQDLSKLQFEIIKIWSQDCAHTTIVGDPDQAIFGFAGAAPEEFDAFPCGQEIVLDQSYRVPPIVHKAAMETIRKVTGRKDIKYLPDERYTPGRILNGIEPDLSLPGEHMILCRTNQQVDRWRQKLLDKGILFKNDYRPEEKLWNPHRSVNARAARTYAILFVESEAMSQETRVRWGDVKAMLRMMPAKGQFEKGVTKKSILELPWSNDTMMHPSEVFIDLLKIKVDENYDARVRDVRKNLKMNGQTAKLYYSLLDWCFENEKWSTALFEEPRIAIGTVHSVKGGAADWVWLDRRQSRAAKKAMIFDPEVANVEHRIVYVAMTRARKGFGWVG